MEHSCGEVDAHRGSAQLGNPGDAHAGAAADLQANAAALGMEVTQDLVGAKWVTVIARGVCSSPAEGTCS
jgi:hypothetical protein